MERKKILLPLCFLLPVMWLLAGCGRPSSFIDADTFPPIFPDYVGVTVPLSMQQLPFEMSDGRRFSVEKEKKGDTLFFQVSAWEQGSSRGMRYKPFPVYLSHDDIDPYVAYRLIEPGYESWRDMGIYQRELGSFDESPIVTNDANNKGCVNCHSFVGADPERMLFHARGQGGGTVFVDGENVRLLNLAKVGPRKQGTYPAWHPAGRYVAFSSNNTHQCFSVEDKQPIEVYDLSSDIILMDVSTDSIYANPLLNTADVWETFPAWNEEGTKLFFCAADSVEGMPERRAKVRYRLMEIGFSEGKFVGEPIVVWECDTLSVSFPVIKGNKLLFTTTSHGTFPIWHQDADLWMLDLETGIAAPCDDLNSFRAESYHSWSSNGKWVIFGSRRLDGRYTRLFIAHYEGNGRFSKPFLLPQKSPQENILRLKSYNRPEFMTRKSPELQKQVRNLFAL